MKPMIGDIQLNNYPYSDDFYFGTSCDDRILTVTGDDVLIGGKGNDHFFSHNHDSFRVYGGQGIDRIDIVFFDAFEVVDHHRNKYGFLEHVVIESGDQYIDIRNVENIVWHIGI